MNTEEMLNTFLDKIPLKKRRFEKDNYSNFPTLGKLLLEYEADTGSLSHNINEQVMTHLTIRRKSFENYFMSNLKKAAA